MGLNPYALLGAVIVIIGLITASYSFGVRTTNNQWEAKLATAQQEKQDALNAANERNNQLAAQLEQEKQNIKIKYQTVTKTIKQIVEKPIYHNICFDTDGVRAANTALSGGSPDTGQPNSSMPSLRSARQR